MWWYFVHYSGWNKKYDTWVEDHGLIKMPQGDAVGVPGGVPGVAAQGPKKRVTMKDKFLRPGAGAAGAAATEGGAIVLLELDMPAPLKKLLIENYDLAMEDAKLVTLPRRPSVASLLQRYCADAFHVRGSSGSEEELSLGLRSFFDKTLQSVLLYRIEREQAASILSDGRVASSVYGAEHLLRLLIKLPELMSLAIASEEQATNVAIMVQDLMAWMVDNMTELFQARDTYVEVGVGAGGDPMEEN